LSRTWDTLSEEIYDNAALKLRELEKLTEEMILDRAMNGTNEECSIIVTMNLP